MFKRLYRQIASKDSAKNPVTPIMAPPPLHTQTITRAPASVKIQLSILSTALVDALGGPAEFHQRFSFPLVTSMIPNTNFALPAGVWTDDTSMTLCLAHSISTSPNGFDEAHQLETYVSWWKQGKLSANGRCFDIGSTIHRALGIWFSRKEDQQALERIRTELGGNSYGGNGSLMRVLPVGLAYWRNKINAREYAKRSSATTHPNLLCGETCEVWTSGIVRIMNEAGGDGNFTKLDLLKNISAFPFTQTKLRDILALPASAPPLPNTDAELEEYYLAHHPLLQLIALASKSASGLYNIPQDFDLPSSGYVFHTLVAALYCFFATSTFEEGAIMAVNLGDDADTVGAVYGGLAGCWYASEDKKGSDGASELFWTSRVREWRKGLVKRAMVEEVAAELVKFSQKLGA